MYYEKGNNFVICSNLGLIREEKYEVQHDQGKM